MTITVGAFEAKTRLSALLDSVEAGDEVLITKRGRPVARLIRVEDSDRQAVDAAIAGLRDARVTTSLGGLDWKALRDEGRR